MTNHIPKLTPKGLQHPPGSLAAALGAGSAGVLSAPAHPFDVSSASGIKWSQASLELWLRGERLDIAEVATASAQACWRELAFVQAFPTVTHWWFGSAWTQRVRATEVARRDARTHLVWLQAVQDDADELMWVVQSDGAAHGPLPAYAGDARNIVLTVRLGLFARMVVAGQLAIGQWAVASSLIAAADLPAFFRDAHQSELVEHLRLS